MTVTTTNTETTVVADGIEVTFNFDFQCLDTAWVFASEKLAAGGTLDRTDITVVLNADQEASPGGTVTFAVAPINLSEVTMFRRVPRTQETDYTEYDAFPAESHEDALDKLTMLTQENLRVHAIAKFDGVAVELLTGRGFSSVARTAAIPAGSWDMVLLDPITEDDNMLLFVSGPTFGNAVVAYNLGRIDDQTLRVQCSYIPDGTDVVNTPVDSIFNVFVVDLTP